MDAGKCLPCVQREVGTAGDSPGVTHSALASVPDQILILP